MIFYFPMGRTLKFALQLLPKIGFPVYSKKEPPDGWQWIIQAFLLALNNNHSLNHIFMYLQDFDDIASVICEHCLKNKSNNTAFL
jgi:hypothetical protein